MSDSDNIMLIEIAEFKEISVFTLYIYNVKTEIGFICK